MVSCRWNLVSFVDPKTEIRFKTKLLQKKKQKRNLIEQGFDVVSNETKRKMAKQSQQKASKSAIQQEVQIATKKKEFLNIENALNKNDEKQEE